MLTFFKQALAASTAAVVATVAICWNDVSPYWSQIVNAFKAAFEDTVDNIVSAFNTLKSDAEDAAEQESKDRVDDVLSDKEKVGTTGSGTKQYEGEGGMDQALEDFNKLNEGEVTVHENDGYTTYVGHLPDGTTINARDYSTYTDNAPTLQIQGKGSMNIKIRYK